METLQKYELQKNFLPLMCRMGGLPINQHNLDLENDFKFYWI